ncbi:MAG TPA: orotidine-5'-phosphate decarboxylase [Candidatus Acidoferrales bacterium]|nr:orotidine-5'-phosphate decarboxylase [Candidatus Acidoferrales bacterium]
MVALDFGSLPEAIRIVKKLKGRFGLVKIGNQLFTSAGPAAVKKLAPLVPGIFLDLKFCDIPNTVSKAVAAAATLPKVRLLTLHTTGGFDMLVAAKQALAGVKNRPKLLGVTVLTSLDDARMVRVGLAGPLTTRVQELARLAKEAGMDGVVASPHEFPSLRPIVGNEMLLVAPGVRPATGAAQAAAHDQARIATPGEAIRLGADYLVVGRAITAAPDPAKAADAILQEMDAERKMLSTAPRARSAAHMQ